MMPAFLRWRATWWLLVAAIAITAGLLAARRAAACRADCRANGMGPDTCRWMCRAWR